MHPFDRLRSATGFAMLGALVGGLIGEDVCSAIGACLALILFGLGDWK